MFITLVLTSTKRRIYTNPKRMNRPDDLLVVICVGATLAALGAAAAGGGIDIVLIVLILVHGFTLERLHKFVHVVVVLSARLKPNLVTYFDSFFAKTATNATCAHSAHTLVQITAAGRLAAAAPRCTLIISPVTSNQPLGLTSTDSTPGSACLFVFLVVSFSVFLVFLFVFLVVSFLVFLVVFAIVPLVFLFVFLVSFLVFLVVFAIVPLVFLFVFLVVFFLSLVLFVVLFVAFTVFFSLVFLLVFFVVVPFVAFAVISSAFLVVLLFGKDFILILLGLEGVLPRLFEKALSLVGFNGLCG